MIIRFLDTFKLVRDTNNIQEGAAMWVILHYVDGTTANARNSRLCVDDGLSPFAVSVRNEGPGSHRKLRSYAQAVNNLLK